MNEAKFLGKEVVFGTYFLGEYTEITGKSFQEAMADIERNPFKYIPLFILTAINTTAELNGTQGVELKDVVNEIDRLGINSDEVSGLLTVFANSISERLDKKKVVKKANKK